MFIGEVKQGKGMRSSVDVVALRIATEEDKGSGS